jgi:hypothetical protein
MESLGSRRSARVLPGASETHSVRTELQTAWLRAVARIGGAASMGAPRQLP